MSGSTTSSGSGATRDPSQTPFSSNSVFNLPIGSNAQWGYNDQLANSDVFVNTTETGYTENIYTGTGNDPLVTVDNSAAAGGKPGTFKVHIPSDADAAAGNDGTLTVDDTTDHTWYSFGGFNWTGPNSATVSSGSAEPDNGSGITQYGSSFDEGVGTLRQSDLSAGTIDHMLRIELPTNMVEAAGSSFTDMAANAWPQIQTDGFAVNGNGGTPYSGTIPYGVTIGIPAGTAEPADVKNNAGANMLWQALRNHGAMIRDTTGDSGNTVVLQADQDVNPGDPLVRGMDQYGPEIMAATRILTNQGPDSVNGGGTPIVALNPPVGDASSSSNAGSGNSGGSNASGSGSGTDTTGSTAAADTSGTGSGSGTDTSGSAAATGSNSSSGSGSTDTAATGASGTTDSGSGGSGTGTDASATPAAATDGTGTGGSGGSGSSDTATITPDTLSSGQSGSGSSSGMSFAAAPANSDPTAPADTSGSGSGSGSGSSGSDTTPNTGLDTSGTSTNDFTAPGTTGTSDPTANSGGGGGYSAWMSHHPQAAHILASQQG